MAASVNRVDVACDLDAPGFEPEPDSFVAPARTQAQSYHPSDGLRAAEVTVHRLARRVNGVTVGRMPGRQLCLYDKRADSLPTPREIKLAMISRQLVGLSRSYAALAGLRDGEAEELPELVAALLRDDWRQRPDEAEQGLARARARYGILD